MDNFILLQCHLDIRVYFTCLCIFLLLNLSTGFLWEVWPLLGILQADRNWVAAGSQDRGKDAHNANENTKAN